MPGLDQGLAGLIADLDDRGMLDETLVLCLTEHGRTPKMNSARGGGRDHWSQAYSVLLAGGGVARGQVIGKTDAQAGTVRHHPISPKDILATTYHLLGIDPHGELRDRSNRPLAIEPTGQVIEDVFA
jgi:arylsulfatase A-like enzyme